MSSERWQRIQELFEAALAQPAEARETFIDSACGGEADLRDELRSLVFAHERSAGDKRLPTQWLGPLARESRRFETGDRVAGRYVIRYLLGRGGMGEVWEAWDEELSIPVALKVLRLQAGAGDALERLKHESLLARSVSHPNVCRVYDLSRHGAGTEAAWFLTMELLRGPTLAERLRDRGGLPLTQARPLAEQMAAALDAAHQAGVVHCDFKPANVMLVDRMGEQAVVTDFGLARAQSRRPADEEESSAIFGTPAYMAPEQMRGEEVGPAADIYALGIVLYEMVTGAVPFGGSGIEHARRRLESDPESPRTLVPELDERWEAVILRCLARDPSARFDGAADVTRALAGWEPEARSKAGAGRSRPTLPAERDLFIGREAEVEALQQHFAHGAHLVTLLGPAGMGKTRLAIRYGWQSRDEWAGGVWFADLTDARSEDGVASSVASSLGIQLGREEPIQQLGDAIAGRGQCLVILDNFEPVLALAPTTLGRWLDRAQDARFLITSRERSSLSGEWIQSVGPLPPDRGRALFEARARWLRPGLELAGAEAEAAQEVVRLAEGNPLAIELAAARMRVMSAEQLAVHMQKRFQLLTGGRGVRHETLAAAIDASWEGLCDWERAAWAQCAVFEGGFTLVAAEAVVDLSAMPAAPWIVDVIQSLVDKSLLRTWLPSAGPAGVPQMRFGMFVSMQDYARLKLRAEEASAAGGTAERAAEERHGTWYAGFGSDEAIAALDTKGGVERRRRLDEDLENLIAACRRALRDGRGEVAVASYRAAWAVLSIRGPYQPAIEIGRQLLARDDLEPLARALAMTALGQAEMRSGHMDEARVRFESALASSRELGNRRLEGSAHGDLASLYFELGQLKESRAQCEVALAIARETGNRRLEGHMLTNLGAMYATLGRMEAAESALEAALAIHRERGSRRFEGIVLGTLGMARADQGRLEEAREHYEEALRIHREVGHRRFESIALVALGNLHLQQDRLDEAAECYEAVRTAAREIGSLKLEGTALESLGFLLWKRGRLDEAIAQFQAALDVHRRTGNRRSESNMLTALGDALSEQGNLAEGRAMLAEAERLARENDDPVDIGKILCSQAGLEYRAGNVGLAGRHLDEAERLAGEIGAGPGSILGDMIAKVREMIAVSR